MHINGSDVDAVYESFVRQIAGDALPLVKDPTESLKESVDRDERKTKLQKEMERIEKLARNEKQPKKKFELAQQVQKLRKELEG